MLARELDLLRVGGETDGARIHRFLCFTHMLSLSDALHKFFPGWREVNKPEPGGFIGLPEAPPFYHLPSPLPEPPDYYAMFVDEWARECTETRPTGKTTFELVMQEEKAKEFFAHPRADDLRKRHKQYVRGRCIAPLEREIASAKRDIEYQKKKITECEEKIAEWRTHE